MAEIKATTNEKVFPIKAFLGLNQNPDGDTKLKMGEAAVMYNFRITRDRNLQRRPGTKTVVDLETEQPIKGLWTGYVGGTEYMLGACDGKLYKFWDEVSNEFTAVELGDVSTDKDVRIFGFSNIAYILDGSNYRQWDGHELKEVEGYVPLVAINIPPVNGSGESSSLENINRITYKRRVWLSPDGTGTHFKLPERDLASIDYILDFGTGNNLTPVTDYSANTTTGEITFTSAPTQTVNRYEVGYTAQAVYTELRVDGSVVFSIEDGRTVYQLPDKYLAMIATVELSQSQGSGYALATGYTKSTYTSEFRPANYIPKTHVENSLAGLDADFDLAAGTVTLNSIPENYDTITFTYMLGGASRAEVERMQYSELFAGTQDTRIFLYGDGTNRTVYSGIDYNGVPRADYFPDLYEARVGDKNTPITGMIRHYSSLACFKKDSAWSISASTTTLAEGLNIPSFYVAPVNKNIGNEAPGQVSLVLNSPFTLYGNDLYEWKNSSYYTSNLTRDERQAKRISDRVWAALKTFDFGSCYCYDDNDAQEYYICYDGEALIYNYAADAWSRYTAFPVSCMANIGGELYIGSTDGKLKHFSYEWPWDDGEAIDAYWESGSMSFNQDYMRKYSAVLWVAIKPESNGEVYVTVQTDRSSTLNEKVVDTFLATFSKANFEKWSFIVNRKPHLRRLKIKAKKFVYYKLIFKSFNAGTRATVVAADIRVRYTGMAK